MRRLVRWAATIPALRSLLHDALYDVENAGEFASLYEHEQMIADRVRIDAYHAGIQKHVSAGHTVIDLGTGSGILALFAEQAGAKKIYAVDHSDFIAVGRQLAADNGSKNIEFLKINSRELSLPEKADVLIHEQIGDDLFNENMLENLLDLKRRVLKPEGRILPGRFELYLDPVQVRDAYRVPYLWENKIHGIDYAGFHQDLRITDYKRGNYEARFLAHCAVEKILCEALPMLSFDLNAWAHASQLPTQLSASRTLTSAGTLDGFCLYFRVLFDDQNHFGTSPISTRTHWANRLFRTTQRKVAAGETLSWNITLVDPLYAETWQLHVVDART